MLRQLLKNKSLEKDKTNFRISNDMLFPKFDQKPVSAGTLKKKTSFSVVKRFF